MKLGSTSVQSPFEATLVVGRNTDGRFQAAVLQSETPRIVHAVLAEVLEYHYANPKLWFGGWCLC